MRGVERRALAAPDEQVPGRDHHHVAAFQRGAVEVAQLLILWNQEMPLVVGDFDDLVAVVGKE